MTGQLIVIYTATSPAQAEIAKGLLEAAGIPAAILRESAGSAYGLTLGPLGTTHIMVAEERAAEAKEILAGLESDTQEEENDR